MLDAKHSAEERGKVQSEWLARRELITSDMGGNKVKRVCSGTKVTSTKGRKGYRTKGHTNEGVRTSRMRFEGNTSLRGGFERRSNAVLALRWVPKAQRVEDKFVRCIGT